MAASIIDSVVALSLFKKAGESERPFPLRGGKTEDVVLIVPTMDNQKSGSKKQGAWHAAEELKTLIRRAGLADAHELSVRKHHFGYLVVVAEQTPQEAQAIRQFHLSYVQRLEQESPGNSQGPLGHDAETGEHLSRAASERMQRKQAGKKGPRKPFLGMAFRDGPGAACGGQWHVVPGSVRHVGSIPQDYDDGTREYVHVSVDTVDIGHLNMDGSVDECRVTRSRHGIGFTWPDGHKESSRKDAQFWPWLAAKVGADVAAEARALIQERDKAGHLHAMYVKRKKR